VLSAGATPDVLSRGEARGFTVGVYGVAYRQGLTFGLPPPQYGVWAKPTENL